jgi:hypothetical protein
MAAQSRFLRLPEERMSFETTIDAGTYQLDGGGGQSFTRQQLRDMIRSGELHQGQGISRQGSGEWGTAGELPELQRYFDLAASQHAASSAVSTGDIPISPEAEPSLLIGVLLGALAMVVTAALWAAITVATDYQIGFMAIGVGFAVGVAVRYGAGAGSPLLATIAAGLSLTGCILGNLLSGCWFIASNAEVAVTDVVMAISFVDATEIVSVMFSPIDLLFYGLAIYYSFKLASAAEG